ncbi:MAG: mechanosensitive ion channel [Verrucomicrobiota bacterium]
MIEKITGLIEGVPFIGTFASWIVAILIFILGYFILKLICKGIEKALSKTTVDDKLAKLLGQDTSGSEKGIATFIFYVLLLFLLIFVLRMVGQNEIVDSLQGILNSFLAFIPKLIGAGLILLVAYILAKVVREILTGLLNGAGVDSRLGTGDSKPVATTVGMIAFFGIILLMLPAALNTLEMPSVAEPINSIIAQIFDYIPFLFAGILLFAIGYMIAKIVSQILTNVLQTIGADSVPEKIGYKSSSLIGGKTLSELVGIVVFASILVTISAQAITVMNLGFISDLAQDFVPGFYRILIAVIIFAIAFFVANLLAGLVSSPFWSKCVRVAVIVFLGAVALQKANISSLTNDTFQLAITAVIIAAAFALGVGGAIAFGLGGRDKAKATLENLRS